MPLASYVAGLAASGFLVNPRRTLIGLSVATLLCLIPRASSRIRNASLLFLFTAIGLLVGRHTEAIRVETEARFDRIDPERFVLLEAYPDLDWQTTPTGLRLRVRDFTVMTRDDETIDFSAPLTIYAPEDVPEIGTASTIRAEGFLRRSERGRYWLSVKSKRLIEIEGGSPSWHPRTWNRRMVLELSTLAKVSPESERAIALVEAIALGRSDQLSSEIRESYRRGGTYHLLVFSGMQIAFAAGLMLVLFRWLRAPRVADWILVLLSIGAPLFVGSDSSVTRASWMIGLWSFSRILHRPTSHENLFFVSMLIRLILVPDDLTRAGFALTYAATAGLIFIGKPLATGLRSIAGRALVFGIGAEAMTFPLLLHFFGQFVIGGFAATVLVSPVLTVMLTIASLVSALVLVSTDYVWLGLELISSLDSVVTTANTIVGSTLRLSGTGLGPAVPLLIATYFTLVVLQSRSRRTRWLTRFVAAIPIAAAIIVNLPSGGVLHPTIDVLDVGQGDSILIRDGDHAVLVDGGGVEGWDDFGRRELVPLLLERGVRELDAIALTHPDSDHCGGLPAVVESLEVGAIWISPRHLGTHCAEALLSKSIARDADIRFIHNGDRITAGALRFEAMVPRLVYKRASTNNSSVVYRLTAGSRRILLTGDIEKEAEATLVEDEMERLGADVIKIPHHGGRLSTSGALLDAVGPRIGVVSCGAANPFGHPSAVVLDRLQRRGVRLFRTDRQGTISLVIRGGRIFPGADKGVSN